MRKNTVDDTKVRLMRDSLGDVEVPADALYGPQTQRAITNFAFSGFRFPRAFLASLGLIKRIAAEVNAELGLLDPAIAKAIESAAREVESGRHDLHFPIDIFQTGSGTSTNMNANEVIATLAGALCGKSVHPNDHVNLGQSSNDVIPTAIHTSAAIEVRRRLLPALTELTAIVENKAGELDDVVKTGRTHLMDAVPIRMSQELGGWAAQLRAAIERIESTLPRVLELPIGGTAVGTGLNTHPRFGAGVVAGIRRESGLEFTLSRNFFAGISSQDASLELSAQLRGLAVSLLKISNDLRLMNSGPVAGLAEISLPALQPGSSVMPGKVNPVIPEAVAMICAQVVGNDTAVLMAAQAGTFQLNTMLPLIAWNLLSSIQLLTEAARSLGPKAISGFSVNAARMKELAEKNPILATALAPRIGYDRSAEIAKEALQSGRSVAEVARERTSLTENELHEILDPAKLTRNEISS
jgi:fumarate hydratase, class II